MVVRLFAALILIVAGTGCPDSKATRCDDDTFCPADTVCGAGGRCLVDLGACGEFDENTPCMREGDPGFCISDTCDPGIELSGRIWDRATETGLTEATISALDRDWLDPTSSDTGGLFQMRAAADDPDLILEVRANGYLVQHTRPLLIGSADYELQGDERDGFGLSTPNAADTLVGLYGAERDPALGIVATRVGRYNMSGRIQDLGGATATLTGDGTYLGPLYTGAGGLDINRTTTSNANGSVVFSQVEPGTYTLAIEQVGSDQCVATGEDAPATVTVEVLADTVTDAGWFSCPASN